MLLENRNKQLIPHDNGRLFQIISYNFNLRAKAMGLNATVDAHSSQYIYLPSIVVTNLSIYSGLLVF